MKKLVILAATAAATLSAVPASADYREVRIVREYDRDWGPPWRPWRHVEWRGPECRDVIERRYRRNGTVVERIVHRCD